MTKRKASQASLLPTRAPKQPRIQGKTSTLLTAARVLFTSTVSSVGSKVVSTMASMIPKPAFDDSSPEGYRPPSPVSDCAQETRAKIISRPPPPAPKVPDNLNTEQPYPTPENTPSPQTLPPRLHRVASKSDIIDLTGSTPEPSPQPTSQRKLHLESLPAEPEFPPKSFANSTRKWRSIQDVEKEKAASSIATESTTSEASFNFSFTTSATSNTSSSSKPSSSSIADSSMRPPPGLRTAKRPGLSSGSPRRRPHNEKQHIHAHQHKLRVAKIRQELKDQAFIKQKKRGYTGTKIDFDGIFRYASEVRQVIPEAAVVPEFIWEEGYWETIRKTVAAPYIKPYTPGLDEVGKRFRDKDRFLDERHKRSLRESLPAQEEAEVSKLLRTRGVISKCAREQVSDQDITRLGPAQWLNDEIINFYGAMINARSDNKQAKVKYGQVMNAFYLSSFFWEKLVKEGYEKGRLAKWTKKVDIFAKDIILIPVNHHNRHWTAAAINFKRKRIESYDSMNIAGADVCKRLRQYVEQEHQNKKKKPFDWTGWVDFIDKEHPQQENGFDCGVFTCQTLESLSRGEEARIFTQANMPYIRRKMIWEIGHARIRDDDFS